jgi:AraC-like DNA-binding protein
MQPSSLTNDKSGSRIQTIRATSEGSSEAHFGSRIPVAQIKPLVKFLVSEGSSLDSVLQSTGITLEQLTLVDYQVPLDAFIQLASNARRLSKSPTYALFLGKQFFINHDGILACRTMSSTNGLAAMKLLIEYQHLFTSFLEFNLESTPTHSVFSIEQKLPLNQALPHVLEYNISVLYSLGKFCLGTNHYPVEIEFSYPNPGRSNEFELFFDNPVRFECPENRVIIPTETLAQPIIFQNEKSARTNDTLCRQYLKPETKDEWILQKVKQTIRNMPFNDISMETLSQQLYMSTRSLRRHLQNHGVSFKALFENERKRVAMKRVQKQDISIEVLAEELGYQNAASFSRAFKRWFGIAPHHYKQVARDKHNPTKK